MSDIYCRLFALLYNNAVCLRVRSMLVYCIICMSHFFCSFSALSSISMDGDLIIQDSNWPDGCILGARG